MHILLDTNVIISGFLSSQGPPGQLLQGWLDARYNLVTSHMQLTELHRALGYKRLRERIHPAQVQDFVDNIEVLATVVPSLPTVSFSPDPADNLILAAAIAGQADLIVSGDKPGMLSLGEVKGISIVTPREALRHLDTEGC